MSKIKPYKYEEFSLLDIKKYLEEKGYSVVFCSEGTTNTNYEAWREKNKLPPWPLKYGGDMINIVGTDVYIDFPLIDKENNLIFAEIRFEDYPKTHAYEQSKKLFEVLKKKFGRKSNEPLPRFESIKDEKALSYLKNNDSIEVS